MNKTSLYHCTNYESLCSILSSKAFWPSYCYEKADYLPKPECFAFAMVCFADLFKVELKPHLKKFNKDCFLQMSKDWAKTKGLSNVIYYNKGSVISVSFSGIINEFIKRANNQEPEKVSKEYDYKCINMMIAYFKQYEGSYWNDPKGSWSEKTTQFYTEREWRYVPIVKSREAYYLGPEDFLNKDYRKKKRDELIKNGYTLTFDWNDIEQIGVSSFKQWISICRYLINVRKYSPIEVMKKVSIVI